MRDDDLVSATDLQHESTVVEAVPVYLRLADDDEDDFDLAAATPVWMLLSETVGVFTHRAADDRSNGWWKGPADEIHLTHNQQDIGDDTTISSLYTARYAADVEAGTGKTVFEMKRRILV